MGSREETRGLELRVNGGIREGEVSVVWAYRAHHCRALQTVQKTLNSILGMMGNPSGALCRKGTRIDLAL